MNRAAPPSLVTSGKISRELGVPLSRVLHVLATRPHIEVAAYAGRTRLFREAAIAQVRYAINVIDARRAEKEGGAE